MKKHILHLALTLTILSISSITSGELHDRGAGLVYDDKLNITLLQDVQYSVTSGYVDDPRMNWAEANAWVQNLVYYDSIREIYWDDWRLPRANPVSGNNFNYNFSYDGSTDKGHNNTVSELAHIYYVDLENLGYYSIDGTFPQPGYGLENTGPFINFKELGPGGESYYSVYWTETDDAPVEGVEHWDENYAWIFATHNGIQEGMGKDAPYLAWAVRDGDVVPHAVSGYKVTYLWHGEALAINNSGQIAGFMLSQDTQSRHAVIWEDGNITNIGAEGLGFSEAWDINEFGKTVGYYYYNPPLTDRHAFLWENNEMKDLGTLGGIDSRAFGINDLKQVVGVSWALSESSDRPFLWENDQMNDLGLGTNYEAYGINNSEQIILRGPGNVSFLWKDGSLTDLGALGGIRNDVHALNNNGQVVGGAQGASFDLHAYIWENSDIKDLGTLGGRHSRALGINEVSEVVGMSFIASSQHHAFLWKNEQLYDLNDLIQNNDEFDYLEHAYDINDRGQIVVSGRVNGEFPHAFLLTPISELNIDTILTFFDESVVAGTIFGNGPGNSANGRLNALRNMLEMAADLIAIGDIEGACGQLRAASRKCDGDSPPPDFVAGPAASELYDMIIALMAELGCE